LEHVRRELLLPPIPVVAAAIYELGALVARLFAVAETTLAETTLAEMMAEP
jgi:hypothetical protein